MVWLADYEAYGNTAKVVWREEQLESVQVTAEELQPIRFQGQFIDQETGLHYNRFRYFDPDLGMFISRDPIGLMGGVNTFAYAPNPTGWIDPFGLSGCSFRSLVKSDTLLLREAKKLSQAQSKGINDLMQEVSKGNTNAGIGTKVFDGITEFRHKSGGRLYATKMAMAGMF